MDEQKLEKIYEDNAKAVYKYLFCLTHDANLSEELVQETFYQATRSIKNFRGDCKISVWLCQIAKRLWIKEIEKQKKHSVNIEILEHSLESDQNVEADYMKHIDALELFKVLHTFDEKTREVMYLRLTGELSFADIGEIVGESETWARVTFYRGKQKLVKGREK